MSKWVTVFAQCQCGNRMYKTNVGGRTYRSVIKTAVAGEKIRLRLGAVYDENDIDVLSMTISVNGERRHITVDGKVAFCVKSNETVFSDDVSISIKQYDKIEIRTYFADGTVVMTGCKVPSSYSPKGDYTSCEFVRSDENVWLSEKRPFDIGVPMPLVYGVDVFAKDEAYTVAVFGASNEYLGKWVDPFAKELQKRFQEVSVANMSISGGRLLKGTGNKLVLGNLFGDSGIDRFDRDVGSLSGVKYVLIELGGNDLFQPNTFACESDEECPEATEIMNGLIELANKVKAFGIIPVILTLTPMKYADGYNEKKLSIRREINEYINSSKDFLHFDLAKYVVNENDLDAMKEDYHLGDHVHLNDVAGKTIVDNFEYNLFDN